MHTLILNRRQILRGVLGASALSLFTQFGFPSVDEDERTAWYREAKFGMFIHWGPLASVEASWSIMTSKPGGITESEYVSLPARFNPTSFDPDGKGKCLFANWRHAELRIEMRDRLDIAIGGVTRPADEANAGSMRV